MLPRQNEPCSCSGSVRTRVAQERRKDPNTALFWPLRVFVIQDIELNSKVTKSLQNFREFSPHRFSVAEAL